MYVPRPSNIKSERLDVPLEGGTAIISLASRAREPSLDSLVYINPLRFGPKYSVDVCILI